MEKVNLHQGLNFNLQKTTSLFQSAKGHKDLQIKNLVWENLK